MAWKAAGEGPGQVAALAFQALLLAEKPEQATPFLQEALALASSRAWRASVLTAHAVAP